MLKKSMFVSLALGLLAAAPLPALAQTTGSVSKAQATSSDTFTPDEIVAAGHGFFGKASRDFARAVETVFEKQGQRNVNFDWTEFCDTGAHWLRLEIPYPATGGPGGNFHIVGLVRVL